MGRPHEYVSQARHALAGEFAQLQPGSAVLLAVSGGADSMALAASAVYAAKDRAIQLHSLTVDHGLRPESAQEAAKVVEQLRTMGIDARSVRICISQGERKECSAKRSGADNNESSGPEGNARRGRYQALADEARRVWNESLVRESSWAGVPVLLGHNADEQAETVLLGLARGSGARSLAGMPRRGSLPEQPDVPMIRPLIDMRRDALRTVCKELDVAWVEDPTNALNSEWRSAEGDPLKRSAIRHIVMPAMEEVFGDHVVHTLVRTGALLREDDTALSSLADDTFKDVIVNTDEVSLAATRAESSAFNSVTPPIFIDSKRLRAYPRAVRTRVVRKAALLVGARGGELFYSHIDALDKLIIGNQNNSRVDLPGAYAWKQRGIIEIGSGQPPPAALNPTCS